MRRVVVVALALAGCAEVPDVPPDGPPVLTLQVDVTSGSGESFTLTDGTVTTTASFTRSYEQLTDRPGLAKLPLLLDGMPVVIELDMCDSTPHKLIGENVMFTDISELAGFGVVGKLAWTCDFANVGTQAGMKDSGAIGNTNGLPTL